MSERERTIERLREAYAEGNLGQDTFERRVEATLRTIDRDDLEAVSADIFAPSMPRSFVGVAAALLTTLIHEGMPRRGPSLERLALPSPSEGTVLVGRHISCGVRLTDPTISRRHAALRRDGESWLLQDLASTNGVRLNGGWIDRALVRPGDLLQLGSVRLLLHGPTVACLGQRPDDRLRAEDRRTNTSLTSYSFRGSGSKL